MPIAHINGTSIYYRIQGKGVPILFIHPPILNSQVFHYQAKQLSRFFQVILFDIRGHGKSSRSIEPLTYPLIVEDMKQLLDYLTIERTFICGYSMGGSVGLEFLIQAPEKSLGGILIGAMPRVDDWWLKLNFSAGKWLAKHAPIALASLISLGNANNLLTFGSLFATARQANPQNSKQFFTYGLSHNCSEQLHSIKQPVLLVYGSKDQRFHRYANWLHQSLPNNHIYMIPQAKHQIPTKKAELLNQQIQTFICGHIR